MRLYFIRHGESEANIANVFSNRPPGHALTAAGREQARGLAERLQPEGLTAIYSSPLLRATQTADILAQSLGLSVTVTDALREYDMGIHEGSAEPAAWEANRDLFQAWTLHHRWDERIQGGESWNDMRQRLEPFVQGLVSANAEGDSEPRLALVGHGGLYLAMLPLLLTNITPHWALTHPFGNTALAVAEHGADGLVCLSWCGVPPDAA